MFVEVLRRYIETLPPEQRGWLAGLRDDAIGRALGLLHGDPARAWTLDELAAGVASSLPIRTARARVRTGRRTARSVCSTRSRSSSPFSPGPGRRWRRSGTPTGRRSR